MAGEQSTQPPFQVVKEVGQDRFELQVNKMIAQGFRPVGGVWVMTVQHPITGTVDLGFLLGMLRIQPSLS